MSEPCMRLGGGSHLLTVIASCTGLRLLGFFVPLGVALTTVGCGGDEYVEPGEPFEATVELGTGEDEFEPIVGEPTLRLAAGSQGGFHVWTSFVARGFDEKYLDIVLTTTVIDQDDSRLVMRPGIPGDVTVEDGVPTWRFAGWPAQVKRARCANGKRVHLELTITDSRGREASDERYCVASLAEEYRAVCE